MATVIIGTMPLVGVPAHAATGDGTSTAAAILTPTAAMARNPMSTATLREAGHKVPDGIAGTAATFGPYIMVSAHSGLCAGVADSSIANGANVVQWDCVGALAQEWYWTDIGNGFWYIWAAHSAKCLSVADSSTANGAYIIQWDCGPGAWAQQWEWLSPGDNLIRLTARHSGKCMSIVGKSIANGARLNQWDPLGVVGYQLWALF